jgi:glycerol-3-phosphate dehydrogenase
VGCIGHQNCGKSLADVARGRYDVVIVGGGIYGAMLHLEAARNGLKSVLVERGDFGAGTSQNSLRIVHGGLRYLKSLNVARSIESTRERQWYLASLPPLVEPLPCLLPIYQRGGKRTSVLKLGLKANDLVSAAVMYLDSGLRDVPHGQVIDAAAAQALAPAIPSGDLAGGAVWHDLLLRCPGRVIVEALRWAADLGGAAVNYVEARDLLVAGGRVHGVAVGETEGRAAVELAAPVVINAAGPWAGELVARWHVPDVKLTPLVVAWNVLLDRPALSAHAVALQDPLTAGTSLLFATSLGGRLMIGTGYAPLGGRSVASAEAVAEAGLDEFLAEINRCVPGLEAGRRDVLRVFAGALPAGAPGSSVPRARNVIRDHSLRGLVTVSGSKFTTARNAARQAMAGVRRSGAVTWPRARRHPYPPCHVSAGDGLFGNEWTMRDLETQRSALEHIVEHEAVEHLDDLVLRRTTLGDQPARALTAARALCAFHEPWRRDADKEVARLAARLRWRHAARAMNKADSGLGSVAKTA